MVIHHLIVGGSKSCCECLRGLDFGEAGDNQSADGA